VLASELFVRTDCGVDVKLTNAKLLYKT